MMSPCVFMGCGHGVGVAVKHGRRIGGFPAGGGTVNEVDGGRLGKGSVVHTGVLAAAMNEF
jgi:hypothetical protein